MPSDIFISYTTRDRAVAENICTSLENVGIQCWIAPRDLPAGAFSWPTAIVDAIENIRVMIVVVSAGTFNSRHVEREVERADSKGKIIIPFFVEDVRPKGTLEYYFAAVQWIYAYSGHTDTSIQKLVLQIREALQHGSQFEQRTEQRKRAITDDDLVALGRAICWDVREELTGPIGPEETDALAEPKHGQQTRFIDLACNRRARRAISRWESRYSCKVLLVGEDLQDTNSLLDFPPVLCSLDSLDGTEHWLRSRNLYCTAVSIFLRGDDKNDQYRLRVSMIQNADGIVFLAREDSKATFIDGHLSPLIVPKSPITDMGRAHVCTVCRRPDHYRALLPLLKEESPFAGLYTFGGNPILTALALGYYDAVFQPDASSIKDSQPIWDWLPGLHIAQRSGCCILHLDGKEFNVPAIAESSINSGKSNYPFVATANSELALAIVNWLASR